MNRIDVLMVIKTIGLNFDDRLRKESLSLKRAGLNVHILVLEEKNQALDGVTDYQVAYTSVSLRTREWFERSQFIKLKSLELYSYLLKEVLMRRPRCVWVHDFDMIGLIPCLGLFRRLGIVNQLVWDQHELPSPRVFRNQLGRWFVNLASTIPDTVVLTNHSRLTYLVERGAHSLARRAVIVENYPDESFAMSAASELPMPLQHWLGGRSYLLAQGGASRKRHFTSLVSAVMSRKQEALVVVGGYNESEVRMLRAQYPQFDDYVYLTGMVHQMKIVNYIDSALASVILYDRELINNWLCSPNRLYQAISRGCPVIVGNNPPMQEFVELTGAGVVLRDDGRDPRSVGDALRAFVGSAVKYRDCAERARGEFRWELGESVLFEAAGMSAGVD